jgi:hypothetical protein
MSEMIVMVVKAPQLPGTMHTSQGNIIYAVCALILKALRINTSKCTTHHFLKLFEDMDEQPSF